MIISLAQASAVLKLSAYIEPINTEKSKFSFYLESCLKVTFNGTSPIGVNAFERNYIK
jgi:hypothetical protein